MADGVTGFAAVALEVPGSGQAPWLGPPPWRPILVLVVAINPFAAEMACA